MAEKRRKRGATAVRVTSLRLATQALSPAETRRQLRSAIAKLSDTDLKLARGIVINILVSP